MHMPAFDNPELISITALEARVDALEAGVGAGSGIGRINVTSAPYSAVGNGIADNTAAIQSALNAIAPGGASAGYELYFPPGTYLCTGRISNVGSDVKVVGRKATIKFDSTLTNHLISLASGASRVYFENIKFEGNTGNDDYTVNQYAAVYSPGGNFDIEFVSCTFTSCRPTFVAQGVTPSGRHRMLGCTVLESPLPVSLPSDSGMAACHLVNNAVVATRSHGVYIFGYADNVRIANNLFKNITGDAVKFNSASARYAHKNCGVITGNDFQGGGSYCIWIGSDSGDDIVGNFVIGDNTFRNTKSTLYMYNVSSWSGGNNVAVWDWEATGAANSVTAGIIIASAIGVGQLSPSNGAVLSGWVLRHAHPFAGAINFTGIPAAGNTVTVGSVTYTWAVAPSVSTEVELKASAAACCEELRAKLRGARTHVINPVLRGPDDAFETTSVDSTSGTLVIASDATFTLSTTGINTTITAVADKKICFSAVHLNETANILVTKNVFESFNCAFATKSYKPVFRDNICIDTNIEGQYNFEGDYEGNTFTSKRPFSAALASHAQTQHIRVSDAWPKIRNNGLYYDQEYTCKEMLGASGTVPVSSGKAYVDFYYGSGVEGATSSHNSIHFKWTDGDTVTLTSPTPTTYTFTYKGTAPGANEFNSVASLKTLIDAAGGGIFVSSFVPTHVLSADVWIRITYNTVAANGDDCYLTVTTKSWITGKALIDPDASAPFTSRAYFRGGNAAATSTKTWVWTPLANPAAIPHVAGFDATSRALSPVVNQADIRAGVGFYITHGAAAGAGAEKFNWWYAAP